MNDIASHIRFFFMLAAVAAGGLAFALSPKPAAAVGGCYGEPGCDEWVGTGCSGDCPTAVTICCDPEE